MAAPNTFSDKTGQIALTLLDDNFEYVDTSLTSLNTSLTTNINTVQSNLDTVETNLTNAINTIDLTNIVGNTTITGSLTTTDYIHFNGTALIASNAAVPEGSSITVGSNIDHMWFNDSPSTLGKGGTWHFCADTTYKNTGNAQITAGAIEVDYISSSSMQVVHKVYTGKTTYSIPTAGQAGNYITALDTAITPSRTSSKIRVEFNISFEVHQDTIFRLFRVINGTTTEVRRNDDGNYWSGFAHPGYDADNNSTGRTNHYIYIDSPNTTSAVTYRMMIQSAGVGATTFYLNRNIGSTGAANQENAISQCILTEIPV